MKKLDPNEMITVRRGDVAKALDMLVTYAKNCDHAVSWCPDQFNDELTYLLDKFGRLKWSGDYSWYLMGVDIGMPPDVEDEDTVLHRAVYGKPMPDAVVRSRRVNVLRK